ncbi:hypothetical protein O3P69_006442 [Scylla paramamosain]|uniref:Uncharacterized protein n=1 Tax=Scylla paramamosain TaxID=85552 RepID=A0AAW0U5N1_SCYPA
MWTLRSYCTAFKAAHKDASADGGGKASVAFESAVAGAAADPQPDVRDNWLPEAVATNARHPSKSRKCSTPAPQGSLLALLKVMCRGRKQAATVEEVEASGIVVAAAGKVTPQPSISVTVRYAHGSGKPVGTQVVPDTGAQVCVAGPKLMGALGIPRSLLKRRGGLRDVANVLLRPLGSATCSVQYCGRSTTQEVFFVESANRFYISLEACKQLGLVHSDFPHQLPSAATVMQDTNTSKPELADNIPVGGKCAAHRSWSLSENYFANHGTVQYKFQVKYLPGKRNCATDFLSHYPVLWEPDATDEDQADDLEVATAAATVCALDIDELITLDDTTRHLRPVRARNTPLPMSHAPLSLPLESPVPRCPGCHVKRPGWLSNFVTDTPA